MISNGTAAYGMYSRNVALPEVVSALNRAGHDNENICMVLSPAHPDAGIFHDATNRAAGVGSATTTRMIHWFSKFGAVVIPTVGVFVRSEAFLNALFTETHPSSLSRGSRTLVDLGFSPDDAKRLGHQLSDVGALVYVSCAEKAKATSAIELLRRAGAQEAASLGRAPSRRCRSLTGNRICSHFSSERVHPVSNFYLASLSTTQG